MYQIEAHSIRGVDVGKLEMVFWEWAMDSKRFLLQLAALILATRGFAAEVFEMYNGIRQLGMGGASIAIVNDETSIIANPAGLGKVRDMFLTVADPELEASTNGSAVINAGNLVGVTEPQGMLDILKEHQDRYLYVKGQILPSLVVPNFGVGLFGKIEVAAEVVSGTPDQYYLHYTNDLGPVVAYNFRIWDGRIKLGVNGKVINRVEINRDDLDVTRLDYSKGELVQEGVGFSSDVGLILSAPWAWIPTLAVVVRDLGGTNYTLSNGIFHNATERPASVLQTMDAAIALFPIISNRTRSSFTLEYRDVLTASQETDHYRRAHLGLEVNFGDLLFVRAGMNGRYWTAGVEFALERVQFQAASYGEEIGTAADPVANTQTQPREDRRVMAKFVFRF